MRLSQSSHRPGHSGVSFHKPHLLELQFRANPNFRLATVIVRWRSLNDTCAGGLSLIPGRSSRTHGRQRFATAATLLRCLKLSWPGAKPRRWTPPFVTRFDVILSVCKVGEDVYYRCAK